MTIFENLRFAARVAAFAANTIATLVGLELSALVLFKRKRVDLVNIWLPRWARNNLWIFGVKVDVRGPHADEGRLYPSLGANGVGRIFVVNHSSGLDIPIIFTVAEAHCISRHDLANWPLIGSGARRVGTLFVDRTSRRSGASVLREVDQALAQGEGVAMFPEPQWFSPDTDGIRRRRDIRRDRRKARLEPLLSIGLAHPHHGRRHAA